MNSRTRALGFTLVEVAVALAILAIVLTAIGRSTQTAFTSADMLRQQTLAHWVAENRVASRYASRAPLAPGTYSGNEVQAGQTFVWRERVSVTANPLLLRVDVSVEAAATPGYVLATMAGFVTKERG